MAKKERDEGKLLGEPEPKRFTVFRNDGEETVTYDGPQGSLYIRPGNVLRLPDTHSELVVPGLTPVAEADSFAVAPAQLSPGLTTADLPQSSLDELADEAEREERQRRAGWLNEPGPYDGTVPYAGSDDRLPRRQPGVTDKCPDRGTCYRGCGDGPCYRVLNAGPLPGRYDGDVWPEGIAIEHRQRGRDALRTDRQDDIPIGWPIAPSIPPPGQVRTPPWDFTVSPEGKIRYKLRSGDVIWVYVDESSGMLNVESEKSQLSVWPRTVSRIQVM